MDAKEFYYAWGNICSRFFSKYVGCAFCPLQSKCEGQGLDIALSGEIGKIEALIKAVEEYSRKETK